MDADFQFLLEDHGVELSEQHAVAQHYTSVKRFAAIADTRANVRTAVTADFGIRADDAPGRAKMAAMITAWEAASLIRDEDAKLRAEAKVLGTQRPLASSDRAAMKTALERVKGFPLTDADEPAAEYLAHKLEQIENGEPTASYLDEVISRSEASTLQLQTSLDNQGRLRVTRQKPKGKLPQNTEELRTKLRLEGHAWVMLSSKCRGRPYLSSLQISHFDRYVEYLLGDKCYSMKVGSGGSDQAKHFLSVPWGILLQYEYEMRKWAIKEAHRQGTELGDTLHEATRNTELKELYFTSQVALALARSDRPDEPWAKRPRKGGAKDGGGKGSPKGGKDKNQGKDPGKGQGNKGKIQLGDAWYELATHTPDGRELCFAFSGKKGCLSKKCQRVHACRVKGCHGNHPTYQHAEKAGGA